MTGSQLDNFGEGFVPGKVTVSDQAPARALERDYQVAKSLEIEAEAKAEAEPQPAE